MHNRPNSHKRPARLPMAVLGAWLALFASGSIAADAKITDEEQLFEERCGLCHPAERIFLVDLTPEQRRHVVLRMRDRWEGGPSWLSDEDIDQILAYVEKRATSGSAASNESDDQTAKDLFRERCSGCHELDRIYAQVKQERDKAAAWLHVVTRMRAKAPDWISEADAQRIIDYLRERTKPKKAAE